MKTFKDLIIGDKIFIINEDGSIFIYEIKDVIEHPSFCTMLDLYPIVGVDHRIGIYSEGLSHKVLYTNNKFLCANEEDALKLSKEICEHLGI